MISFIINIVILLGPSFLAKIMFTYMLTKIFMELNIENIIGPIMMFGNISTYNIFEKLKCFSYSGSYKHTYSIIRNK
jgi:hypothetical protein